jgi:RNA ligase (TIGR02306 family)
MSSEERKLATIRVIDDLRPIEGADRIELAIVDGWQVVVQKGYNIGDKVIYAEIDSWIPTKIAPFLSRGGSPKVFRGLEGNRLKTIKLKGVVSQGLILPIKETLELDYEVPDCFVPEVGADVTGLLGIIKYEKEIPAGLAGTARGNFPNFVPKTNQERIQNSWKYLRDDDFAQEWMVTEKLDGSSMTVYLKDGVFGVCSRNIDLKEDETNSFWKAARKYDLEAKLRAFFDETGCQIALQGELVGPGIQSNPYHLKEQEFYVFNVYDIDAQGYLDAENTTWLVEEKLLLPLVPVVGIVTLPVYLESILSVAEGQSQLNNGVDREGLVFHRKDGRNSFKAISNKWLLAND